MSRPILNARDGVLSYVDESGQERRIDFANADLTLEIPPDVKREGHFASPGVSWSFGCDFTWSPRSDGRGGNARDRRRLKRRREAIERAIMRAFRMRSGRR